VGRPTAGATAFPVATDLLSKVGRGGFAGVSKTWMFLTRLHGRIHAVPRKFAPSRQTRYTLRISFSPESSSGHAWRVPTQIRQYEATQGVALQFSRDYARAFGLPPARDAGRLREAASAHEGGG
jgi:hypothetical protein